MNPVQLSPLPSHRTAEDSDLLIMEREGFVDEAVVRALANGPRHQRSTADHADLALAADDLDFAGWQLPREIPVRGPEVPPHVISAIVRRATPPVFEEVGIGNSHHSHRGGHRWWLAGLAGALSTMLFTLLLIHLSSRSHLSVRSFLPSEEIIPTNQVEESSPEVSSVFVDGVRQ